MSEKKIQKLTKNLDEIKNMNKTELQEHIVHQNNKNSIMGASIIVFIISTILMFGLGAGTIFLSKLAGMVFLGTGVVTSALSVVYSSLRKKGVKNVEDCVAELSLKLKQEAEQEFDFAKKEINLIIKTGGRVESKNSSRTNSKYRKPKKCQNKNNENNNTIGV